MSKLRSIRPVRPNVRAQSKPVDKCQRSVPGAANREHWQVLQGVIPAAGNREHWQVLAGVFPTATDLPETLPCRAASE